MHNPVIQVTLLSSESKSPVMEVGFLTRYPILSASWSREMGENSSQCSIQIPGDDAELLDKLLGMKLYEPPTQSTQPNPGVPGQSQINQQGRANNQLEHEQKIIQECLKQGVTNAPQIAYILATASHESDRFATQEEYASGADYEGRRDLGNTQPGDGKRFKGRGYVQLTGRKNYQLYSQKVGKDLVGNPGIVSQDQDLSRFILVDGMLNGQFTGARLGSYVTEDKTDYVGARAVVNGSDQNIKIANLAGQYETRLRTGDLANQLQNVPNPSAKLPTQPTTQPPPRMEAGGQILIRSGEFGALIYEDVYLLSGVSFRLGSGSSPIIQISGVSPIWTLNQHKQTDTKSNLSLKQLAQIVAQSKGLGLEFEGEGLTYQHLENNGLTSYQLLLREVTRSGYVMYTSGTKLIIHPMKPKPGKGGKEVLQIPLSDVLSLSSESKPSGATPGVMGGVKGTWTAKPTIQQDSRTGTTQQVGLQKPTTQSTQNQPKKEGGGLDGKARHSDTVNTGTRQVPLQLAQAELSRVMDLPTQLDLIARTEYLSIMPCNLVSVPTLIQFSEKLGETVFWVGAIHLSFTSQGFGMSLDLFKPGASVSVAEVMTGTSSVGSSGSIPSVSAQGWSHPYPGSIMTAPWGERRGNRRHAGQDWSGGNGRILAAADGIISDIQVGCQVGVPDCGGGYGNYIDITSNVGSQQLIHRYAHLSSVRVQKNQQVRRGEQIGVEGDTGRSFGNHLHFEIRQSNQLWGFGGTIDPVSVGIK